MRGSDHVAPLARPPEQRMACRDSSIGIDIHPSAPIGPLDLKGMEKGVDRENDAAGGADFDRHVRWRVSWRRYQANIGGDLSLARDPL